VVAREDVFFPEPEFLVVVGVVYALVAAFRYIGGRTKDRETLSGLALYWYFLAAANTVVWYTVYVKK